jgi:S-DNA-T family DNA segregation ATPase FtsK/SpoIIIE
MAIRKKEKPATEIKLAHELAAIVLMGVGALLLLALISFEPNDVPFFSVGDGGEIDNFIGPVGAYVAAGLVLGFGVASYMIPLVMIVGGVLLIFAIRVNYWMKLLWFALIIITGAGLLQFLEPVIRPIEGMDWPGGGVGYWLHDWGLSRVIGSAGSVIVLALVYASSLILLFEVRPVELIRRSWAFTAHWYEEREKRRFEEADPIEQLELKQKQLEREKKKLERKLNKNKSKDDSEQDELAAESYPSRRRATVEPEHPETESNPVSPSDEFIEDQVVRRPEPKVIDTMAELAHERESDSSEPMPEDESEPGTEAVASEKGSRIRKVKSNKGALEVADERPTFEDYKLPAVSMLDANQNKGGAGLDETELKAQQQLLVDTLQQFGIEVQPGDITKGATITRYEVYPAPGVRVERIAKMNKDIARAMRAESINILAPIPGKDTVGIEIGNADKSMIVLRDLFENDAWKRSKAKLPLALGKDVYGKTLVADLAEMPHLLIGGSTGSGKSVCINSILMSFLYRFSPEDLRIIMVDPKVVELQVYNDLPHLVVPVVTEPKKVLMALRWVINEMELRYRLMAKCGVRNVAAYNTKQAEAKKQREAAAAEAAQAEANAQQASENDDAAPDETFDALPGFEPAADPDLPEKFPYIVVIIDELADLMATTAAEVELAISRLCAKARAAGIHLIIATQTPRAQVVTGVIKTNIPCRIAFKVPSALDSRVILDENGAENLLGKGDMLYLPPGSSRQLRAQGAFVTDEEVSNVVEFIKAQTEPAFEEEILNKLSKSSSESEDELSEADLENVEKALEIAMQEGKLSTSLLQRRARIGYNTAARVVDFLEDKGILGPQEGAKPRELMINPSEFDVDGFLNEL